MALERSGFPFEMFVAREMTRLGMLPNESSYFEDPSSAKLRELDLWAAFSQSYTRAGKAHGEARWVIIVECKKSQSPWVLLSAESGNPRMGLQGFSRPVTRLAGLFENSLLEDNPEIHLMAFHWEPSGRGLTIVDVGKSSEGSSQTKNRPASPMVRPSVGDDQERDPPFSVTRKLAEATSSEIGEFPQNISEATWVYPILALDAPLFSAGLTDDGSLDVTQIETATMLSPPAKNGHRFPLIVTAKSGVSSVLARVSKEIELLRDAALGEELGQIQRDLVQVHR